MHINGEDDFWVKLSILGVAGMVAGLGAMLASKEELTPRIVLGRAISSFTLGIGAATVLLWFPTLGFYPQVGIACVVASLGTSGLERIFQLLRGTK